MKRLCVGVIALLLALAQAASAAGETRLMVVSDIHYLAKPLYEGSEAFLRALRAGDGKLTQYGDELLTALLGEVERLRPDALLVTGDLSFNGEKASHVALAEWLARIEALGVPVWVIPGNHDINVAAPHGFTPDGWYVTEGVDAPAFSEIYADFLLPAEGNANLSYCVPVSDALWVAMTDVSYYKDAAQTFGIFTSGHAAWLERALEAARSAGTEVITATHHNLLAHTDFSRDSYLMFGNEEMAALARRYGVRLNLSGHLHIQHILADDGLADAALGAFCTWPHRYALVTLADDGALNYSARALDPALLPEGFGEMSREWFEGIAAEKARAGLMDGSLPKDEAETMADYAARFNLACFEGSFDGADPAWREDPAYALWARFPRNPFWQYMKMLMDTPAGDNLNYVAEPCPEP